MKKQKSTQNPKDWYFADAVVLVFVDVGQKKYHGGACHNKAKREMPLHSLAWKDVG